MTMPRNSFYFLLQLKSIWSKKMQSFAVCPSGPTEYCGRNWLLSHLMALGPTQQGFVTEVAQSCFVWPTIHWKGPRDIEYPCQRAWKNQQTKPTVPHKGDKKMYQEDNQPREMDCIAIQVKTTQMHPGIDVLKGVDMWTTCTQKHLLSHSSLIHSKHS